MNEDFVTEALKALRRADAGVDAGPEAEIRALLAFRRYRRRKASRQIAVLVATAAAVVVLGIMYRPAQQASQPSVAPAQIAAIVPAPVAQTESLAPARVRRRPREIATDFFPLLESQPPLERAQLVRVTVPAATMRAFGLPVGDQYLSDPVQADLLVGQDDLARAIRFVSVRE